MTELLQFREAGPADLDTVLGVLNEAAQWLVDRGIRQWYLPFPPRLIENDLEHHRVFVASLDSVVVATATALSNDPMFWGDQPPGSWYLHRLARRRNASRAGGALLQWVEARARDVGIGTIRLDCGAALRGYYESAGYRLQWTMSLLEGTSSPPRSLWFCYEKSLTD
jgi:hypothetical protein